MSDRFHLISMEQLTDWVFDELETKDGLFGIPRDAFFVPTPDDPFRIEKYGVELETPFGVAAGPHSQMAQNIIVSWLVGARFIELKTIQTLDELDINKPCIDIQDEGYNVEWSQELKVYESFDEYLRAWVLIHALHHKFGFPGDAPGMIFNMSVGYNLEGMLKPNVQWYFDTMADASDYLPAYIDLVARRYPQVRDITIPSQLSDTITLSTMHGCPPDEIEKIMTYLLEERNLHASVKLNPTLLGADRVRSIVNEQLGYTDIPVPDEAFGHDLMYVDAVPMLHALRRTARTKNRTFGVKLTNTLEVNNWRPVFENDDMMYLSGRALHPVTTNVGLRISEQFHGDLLMSFAGGADCFNVADLIKSGMKTITTCSDILKSGGYLRMLQYTENLTDAMAAVGAVDIGDFVARTALLEEGFDEFAPMLRLAVLSDSGLALETEQCAEVGEAMRAHDGAGPVMESVRGWAAGAGLDDVRADELVTVVLNVLERINLRSYAAAVRTDPRYIKSTYRMDRSKTPRTLDYYDCIEAPCLDECPVDQKVPQYMNAVRDGDFLEAVRLTREDNPTPAILGKVCDHLCENTCIRTHYDEPLAIRQIKRFIMEQEAQPVMFSRKPDTGKRVAVIGAGPAGIAAAQELAYAGFAVTVFEHHPYPAGMVGGAIPTYRIPQKDIDQDMAILDELGVEVRYNQTAGVDFTLEELRSDGYGSIVIAVGAQLAKRLNLPGEDSDGIMDALYFLRNVREGHPPSIGKRVGVIGAGDTAMDCVRSALRVGGEDVSLIYRRTIDQMPADREEIHGSIEEGVKIMELVRPAALNIQDGALAGLVVSRTEYRGNRDASGRKIPYDVPDSDFEIPLDTLILAISQHAILDFFGDETPELTPSGYLQTDPETFETSVANVYAAGDVAAHGPSSIVVAADDGKQVAAAIAAKHGVSTARPPHEVPRVDVQEMMVRRSRREYRVQAAHTPLDDRDNFNETILTYTPEQAKAEASRCLDCHEICSLCVGVCPNMALMTYEIDPVRLELPALTAAGGGVSEGEASAYGADQPLQIAVLTDFCNECGNCETACPTSGIPYVDKPRLYLDRTDFEAEKNNAFMLFDNGSIESRVDGATHRLVLNGAVEYTAPGFTARMDKDTFKLLEASPTGAADGEALELQPAADMYILLKGLQGSMSHLPAMAADGSRGTFVEHPGYQE
ncbi:MAG: FAD-dependent oxidoreductase [Acidimicrobiia bacterium]|nr:FAD-dependent oxidoreductase [Acidimicrobiia bacterium]